MILIVLTAVLVNTMIQTENNTQNIIADIQEQSRLESVAELTRADAIQIFNFGIRKQMHEYLSDPNNVFTVTNWDNWDLLVNDFANGTFGTTTGRTAFADTAANFLIALYQGFGFSFSTYSIKAENIEGFRNSMRTIVQNSLPDPTLPIDQQNKFFEVIECTGKLGEDKDTECPTGTFYVNLKLSSLTPTDRENLPKIVVEDKSTGRILKDPILPDNDVRIYVPLRIFKALTYARAIADPQGNSGVMNENFSGTGGELDTWALGACIPNTCDKYSAIVSQQNLGNNACIGESSAGAPNAGVTFGPSVRGNPIQFQFSAENSANNALHEYTEFQTCQKVQAQIQTKNIPIEGVGNDFGIALDASTGECTVGVSKVGIKITPEVSNTPTAENYYGNNRTGSAQCAGINILRVQVGIKEENDLYKVNKLLDTEYKIEMRSNPLDILPQGFTPNTHWNCQTNGAPSGPFTCENRP
ncbi:MAG: hypothetical protein Q7S92_07100 [Candidatus Diapherotrites archaeon]|nr:hypothetical protein [Candidatus Diapherotrites archaeon]